MRKILLSSQMVFIQFSILWGVLFGLSTNAQAQCTPVQRMTDSLALVDLYMSTDGSNWMNRTNWLSSMPLDDWYGINTNAQGCVTCVDLDGDPNCFGFDITNTGNGLVGTIPNSIGNLSSCTFFSLSYNSLTGTIPSTIGNMTSLQVFRLINNGLSGPIPNALGSLVNLNSLSLGGNAFNSNLPNVFASLPNLAIIDIPNSGLTGSIPSSVLNHPSLVAIYIDRNELDGEIPEEIGNIPNLAHLFLYGNNLTGNIPSSLGNTPNLVQLYLDGNDLSGCIPISMLNQCGQLSVPNCSFFNNPNLYNESWSDFCNTQNGICCASIHPDKAALKQLYEATDGANWTMNLPWDTTSCNVCTWEGITCNINNRVTQIDLNNRNLSGNLVDMNLPFLEILNLFNNQISGNVPNFNLPALRELRLFENNLSGTIPNFNLPELRIMFLGQNDFPGPLPDFNLVPNLDFLGFSQCYNLTGNLPNFSNLPNLRVLYLNDLDLTGPIPNLNLPRVEIFQIEYNRLNGTIPNFSGMPLVRYIYLHDNLLSGNIPAFSNTPALTNFNCSYNNLEGCYPAIACTLNEFNALYNPLLPWEGDFSPFCAGSTQIGAPCDNSNTPGADEILTNCSCDVDCMVFNASFSASTTTICNGEFADLTFNFTAGTGPYTVTWSGGSTLNDIYDGHVETVFPTSTRTYTITSVVDNNGCPAAGPFPSVVITVRNAPNTNNVTGNASVCQDGTTTYTTNPAVGATSYNWTVPVGAIIMSGQGTNSISVNWPAGSESGEVCVTAENGCLPVVDRCRSVNFIPLPEPPAEITGPEVVCQGAATTTYTAATVPGATSYTWDVAGIVGLGQVVSTTGNQIMINWLNEGVCSFGCSATNACGTGAIQYTTVVVVGPAAVPGPVSGPTSVCTGLTVNYSLVGAQPGWSYTWNAPAGAQILGGQGTATVSVRFNTAASGNISVTATDNCGGSSTRQLAVTASSGSALNAGPVTGPTGICPSSNASYTISAVGGANSYQWTIPTGAAIVSGQNTTGISINWGTATGGQVCVSAVGNCGAGTASCVSVSPISGVQVNLGNDTTLCPGASLVLNAGSGAGAYTWSTSATTNSITVSSTGTYSVTISAGVGNTCTAADAITVTFAATNPPAAVTQLLVPATTVNVPVNTALSWNAPGGCLSGYTISIGTTPGGNQITGPISVVGNSYQPGNNLPAGTTVYITIVPSNAAGNGGLVSFSFTTANSTCSTTVTTTANSGPGSLREAINCANSNPGPDTIKFNIPGAGPHVISPASALPQITTTTVLDATTQPGWSLGKIVLDGTATPGNVEGLEIAYTNGSAVYGMVIRNFKNGRGLNCYQDTSLVIGAPGKGNAIYGNADLMTFSQHEITVQECVNTTLQSNIIGLSETLTLVGDPQDAVGIGLEGKNIKIGGNRTANEGNRFGGTFFGINAYDGNNGFTPKNYQIYGNDFGVLDSSSLRCNTGIGVIANIDSFWVGDGTLAQRNRFFSQKIGVSVFSTNNPALSIRYNEFFCNDSIPIERVDVPAPAITSATTQSISGTTAAGAVVEVYAADNCANTPCQGNRRLGVATANASGIWALNAPFENTLWGGEKVTALATLNNRTSGFGACQTATSICNVVSDSLELVKLYNATNGPGWTNKTHWLELGQPISSWYGVQVNAQGCVRRIILNFNQLSGAIPNFNLPNLQDLSLDNNQLSGAIPNFNLPNLKILRLIGNQLSGSVPNFNLPNLQYLFLHSNQLSGVIPNFNLPNLGYIYLDNNQLSGSIPNFSLPNLQELDLSFNQLSGSIPNFNLPNLGYIYLDNNQLSGSIPNFSLPNLRTLWLHNNQLSGAIPDFNLPNLQSLFLYNNQLSGSIPNFSLPNLGYISLENNQLSGSIPNFSLPNLVSLSLSSNQLSGAIPDFNLPNLGYISLENNQLSGSIPNFSLPNLQYLYLYNNQLSGSIPNFSLPNLQYLYLYNNQLSGSIPNFNLPKLLRLYLYNNNLSGGLPFTQMPLLGTSTNFYDSLALQYNHLSFDDILPNMPLINGFYNNQASYAPQDSIFSDTLITRTTGQALTIDLGIDASVATNIYQWYKNGQPWTPPVGNNSNSNQLIFNSLQSTDAGIYHARVTNPGAPALTLYSRAITLNIAAATCTVTTTANSGPGSLREAINCANSSPGPDTIKFNIPGAGPHVISPASALPQITTTTVLDATTQPGWSLGKIVLDGTATPGNVEGLEIAYTNGSAVYGMVIRNFKNGRGLNCYQDTSLVIGAPGKGNAIYGNADLMTFSQHEITVQECVNTTLQSNIIGLSETLTLVGDPQDAVGIGLEGKNIKIGGNRTANEGNRFGGTFFGINAYDGNNGFTPKNYQIYGNDFGVLDSSSLRCNTGIGVIANIDSFWVGDGTLAQRNRFFSQKIGVSVFSANNPALSIRYNEFFCNDSIPIERVDVPAPVITSATTQSISGTTAAGAVVEVYAAGNCANTPCQGNRRLGVATANASGTWALNAPFENTLWGGEKVTALATLNNRTSGFGACQTATSICNVVSDSLELVKLYNATNGPGWTNKTHWLELGQPISTWYGVAVNGDGCVIEIDLFNNQMNGNIPNLNLPNLQLLWLDNNQLSGSIPNFSLTNLQVLSLTNNQLSGSIPNFNLPNLLTIELYNNQLSGTIPNFNLPNLQFLYLSENQLSGTIPNFNLPNLQNLLLDNNQLSGSIPNFNLPNLLTIELYNNQLSGTIPNLNLPNLISLHLRNNNLSAAPTFSQMPLLGTSTSVFDSLTLQYNRLTFDDILPNMPLINGFNGGKAKYAPQDSIFTDTTITRTTGQALTIDLGIDAGLTTNIYQWYKNGQPWTPPVGNNSNSNQLIFNNLQSTDAGIYHARVTNPGAPLLTLHSRAIQLDVAACTTVTTTADSGPGSLREAINCANSNPGPDTIRFNIPGAGPHVIALQTGLPIIYNSGTVVDGTTQSQGDVLLDGSAMSSGEIIYAAGCDKIEVYGLIIKNSAGSGIAIAHCDSAIVGAPGKGNIVYGSGRLDAPYPYDFANFANNYNPDVILFNCTNSKVQANQVGITETGSLPTRPVAYGITVSGQHILVGGNRSAGEGNVIGNNYHGIGPWTLVGNFPLTDDILVYGNNIGTGLTGAEDFGNEIGVLTYNEVTNVRVGNTTDQSNVFKFNNTGIKIGAAGFGNGRVRINQNTFSCNTVGANVQVSPAHPLSISSANTTQVNGVAKAGDIVEVYLSDNTNCSGADCQGTTFLGQTTADNAGNWVFNGSFLTGSKLTATATDPANGWTSAFATCATVVNPPCDQSAERAALEALYNATNGDNWTNKTNWKTAAPVGTWYGVQVDNNGCVQCIDMDGGVSFCTLDGFSGNNLTGSIPIEIGQLSQLTSLNLNHNFIGGSIPAEMGNLQLLETLVLDNNSLTGSIPNSLFQLNKLQVLGFNSNQLEGGLSPLIGNLSMLRILSLGSNNFTGPIPAQLGNLLSLRQAFLNFNQFSGSIPSSIAQIPNLHTLFLSNNKFTQAPNLSLLPFKQDSTNNPIYFAGLRMGHNIFTFKDIIPNIVPLSQLTGNPEIRYAPQDSIFSDTLITRTAGQSLTIDLGIDAGITTNVYQWFKNGQPWQTVTGDNKWQFPGLLPTDAGEYWVHVTNPNAPLLTLESRKITLVVNTCTLAGTPNIVSPNVLCAGTATLQVSGTFSQYNWSNNANTVTTTVTQPGTYTVTVTDANGCTGTDSQNISGTVPAPAPVISGPTALCGSSSVLAANAGFTQYIWSNNATTANLTVTQPGTYTVTVTDANGCTGTNSQSINGTVPTPAPVISGPTALCGSSSVLTANAGFVQYIWSNNATTANLTVTQPGTYTVTVTDANGCTGTDSQVINGTVPAPAPVISGPTALCGSSSVLTANAGFAQYIWSNNTTTANLTVTQSGTYTVTVTDANGCTGTDSQVIGGSVPAPAPVISGPTALCGSSSVLTANAGFAQYIWSNNATTANLTVTQPGTYTVTVTDANGCTGTNSQVISGTVPAPAPVISGPTALCGSSSVLTANAGFTQYIWSNNANTANLTVTQPGTYTVTVTDANGCTGTDSQSINGTVPAPAPVISGPTALCGSSSVLTANAGFVQYIWSNNATTANISVTQPGTYAVTVTDANGCTGTNSQSINGTVPAPTPVISGPTALCGSSSVLAANAGFVQYIWSNNANTANLTVTQPGTYTVTVTDANGCTGTDSQSISGTVPAPAPVISGPTALCGSSSVLTANAGFTQYIWSNNATTANLTVTQPGTYTVTVTDANGCTGTNSVEMTAGAPFTTGINVSGDTLFCPGGSVALNGIVPPGGTAQWLFNGVPIPNATSANWTADTTGVYTLLVEKDGCAAQSTPVQTTLLAAAVISLDEVLAAQCGAAVGAIQLTVSNTSGNVTYQWSNNANTRNINGLAAGVYTVTVTNGNACTTVWEQEITGTAAPQPELVGETLLKPGDKIVLGTTETYAAYLWSTGDVTSVLEVSTPGTYELTVTNADGCTGTLIAEVTSNLDDLLDDAELIIPRAITPYSTPGQNDGFDPVQALLNAQRPVDLAQSTRLIIYARQGEVLVVLDPYPSGGWVGALIPPDLPEGTYYYHLEFVFPDGNKAVYKGALNLVR
jgi:Leucine-rich repeat (LRR) protein